MSQNQQGEFYVALTELRASIEAKIDKVDERQRDDIAKIEEKNDKWQGEVREEFSDVKNRLTVIETQTATMKDVKKTGWDRVLAVAAIVVSVLTAIIIGMKP